MASLSKPTSAAMLALAFAFASAGTCAAWRGVVEPHTMTELWKYDEATVPLLYPNGTSFSGVVGNRAVLQRGADTAAVVFGRVAGGVTEGTSVTVTVAEAGAGSYTVVATVITFDPGGGNLTWRAALKPHLAYGGRVMLTAQCKGCTNTTAAVAKDLTYGDGQSFSERVR